MVQFLHVYEPLYLIYTHTQYNSHQGHRVFLKISGDISSGFCGDQRQPLLIQPYPPVTVVTTTGIQNQTTLSSP